MANHATRIGPGRNGPCRHTSPRRRSGRGTRRRTPMRWRRLMKREPDGMQRIRARRGHPGAGRHSRRRARRWPEPGQHHRAEHAADAVGALVLHGEQAGQHNDGQAEHHAGRQAREHGLEPLDGGEHRDRRGDDTVAEQQRAPEQAKQDDRRGVGALLRSGVAAMGSAAPSARGCRPRLHGPPAARERCTSRATMRMRDQTMSEAMSPGASGLTAAPSGSSDALKA